jgi:hypothetical protein
MTDRQIPKGKTCQTDTVKVMWRQSFMFVCFGFKAYFNTLFIILHWSFHLTTFPG